MLPPDMMSALGGGGAPDPTGMGGAPEALPPEAQADGSRSTTDILEEMIAGAQEYLGVEQDEEDKLTMTKVLSQLQGYLAAEQKEQDELLGGKASPRSLRRASGGGV